MCTITSELDLIHSKMKDAKSGTMQCDDHPVRFLLCVDAVPLSRGISIAGQQQWKKHTIKPRELEKHKQSANNGKTQQ